MKNNRLSRFAIPYVIWMALFVVAPIIMVVIYAFSTADGGATLANFAKMGTYTVVFTRSFKLALIATAICLLIGYPVSYVMSKEGPRFQRLAMVLIMLPMWMNFLLRTLAWQTLLEKTGVIVVPGSAFGRHGEGYVRMALVVPPERMQEAVRRIAESGILNR